jgi:uncharacterized coiled-coil protein SlyX
VSDIDHGIAATVGGAIVGGVMAVRRMFGRDPETPEGHARRLAEAEREIATLKTELEGRMQTTETTLAGAIGKLTESTDRQWKAIDRLTDTVDNLRGAVVEMDVETKIERALRRHPPTDKE